MGLIRLVSEKKGPTRLTADHQAKKLKFQVCFAQRKGNPLVLGSDTSKRSATEAKAHVVLTLSCNPIHVHMG
jgi:hypothetical protein